MSDAGDLYFQHALELYEPGIHIPAILWAPGRVAAGRVHRSLACQEDLAPTLLGASGLSAAEGSF